MKWAVLWDFVAGERWLDDFLPKAGRSVAKVSTGFSERNWHQRTTSRSAYSRWTHNGLLALEQAKVDGVITVFPQLAVLVGLYNRFWRRKLVHIAWAFNIGHKPNIFKRVATSVALGHVSKIVVHSRAEVTSVSRLFGVRRDRIEFVPLQGPDRPHLCDEDDQHPFIVAIGSANRDYTTLLHALAQTGLPGKIVTSRRLADQLSPPKNVELIVDASWESCLRLAQSARLCVTPLLDPNIATGQVTIIDHLTMGRPVVATRSIGTVDYIVNDVTGKLIDPRNREQLVQAMLELWNDKTMRNRLGAAGKEFAKQELSDAAIGKRLGKIMTEFENRRF